MNEMNESIKIFAEVVNLTFERDRFIFTLLDIGFVLLTFLWLRELGLYQIEECLSTFYAAFKTRFSKSFR